MDKDNLPVYVFNTHIEAEEAVKALSKSGYDVKKLSIIGKGDHTEETPIGFYTMGDRVKAWGGMGAFWGGIWGLLIAPAVFFLPGFGLLAMAGPVVAALIAVATLASSLPTTALAQAASEPAAAPASIARLAEPTIIL